ncbi:MAG: hypothetical protein RL235_335 [Chlamydiota bacterium]|jgi:biopolymer transport protein ExbD
MPRRIKRYLDADELEEPLINLTPLIDVVFVVLIAFMLIAPMLEVDRVELATAGPMSRKEAPHDPLSIAIRADDTIVVRGKTVTMGELTALLQSENKQRHPLVLPDKKARFGTYQAVKNTLEQAGFEQMDVALEP